jgi:hypothetical protein
MSTDALLLLLLLLLLLPPPLLLLCCCCHNSCWSWSRMLFVAWCCASPPCWPVPVTACSPRLLPTLTFLGRTWDRWGWGEGFEVCVFWGGGVLEHWGGVGGVGHVRQGGWGVGWWAGV